jgi:hypothetical protein
MEKLPFHYLFRPCVYNGRECGERGASPRRQHIKDAPFGAISTTNSPSFIPFVRKKYELVKFND